MRKERELLRLCVEKEFRTPGGEGGFQEAK